MLFFCENMENLKGFTNFCYTCLNTFMFDTERHSVCYHMAVSRSLIILPNLLFSSLAILPAAALTVKPVTYSEEH